MQFSIWWQAFRPKTLTAALIPVAVGTALTISHGEMVKWWITLFAALSATFIQIGTNLVNDALDHKKGADTSERLGPTRVTSSGLMSYRKVMWAAVIAFLFALVFGLPLVLYGGWPIVVIGVISLFLGYAYTGGPFPLAYVGLGDLFVILFFGLIAVSGTYYLQTHQWSFESVIAGLQIGFLATTLIAINNLRDMNQDVKVGKRTMAVRLGLQGARLEIAALFTCSFLLSFYWIIQGLWMAAFLPWLCWPLAYFIIRDCYRHKPGPIYNTLLAKSALVHMLFGSLLSVGLIFV